MKNNLLMQIILLTIGSQAHAVQFLACTCSNVHLSPYASRDSRQFAELIGIVVLTDGRIYQQSLATASLSDVQGSYEKLNEWCKTQKAQLSICPR